MSRKIDDELLLASILKNENSTYLKLMYKRMHKKVQKIVADGNGSKEDAKDVLHDTILLFFKAVREGSYIHSKDIDAYLYTIARNCWVNKAKRNSKIIYAKDAPDSQYSEQNPLKTLYLSERANAIQEVINRLGEKCKQLIQMLYFEEKSTTEIIEGMGYSNADAVKSRHYRCKQSMLAILNSEQNYVELFSK